jgi:uncharacterized protein YqjF (DUF2071 family)
MDLLRHTEYQPYPLPKGLWIMRQTWQNLLFAHWPVSARQLSQLIPSGYELDTFEGDAWVSVVPFEIAIQPRGLHQTPFRISFNEINVRTYVKVNGKPGVYFFSLDASEPFSVRMARWFYKLPYFDACIKVAVQKNQNQQHHQIDYESKRTHARAPVAEFKAIYAPTSSEIFHPTPGTLEHWLTERYALFTHDQQGHLYIGEIHHPPWLLQQAKADILLNSMAQAHQITLPNSAPILHFSEYQDVLTWPLKRM